MNQIIAVWNTLSVGRRIVVVLATLAVFISVLALGRIASTPSLSLLYAGLEPQAAAEVIAALDGQGAIYEVRGNAVYVAASRRDTLRMQLAGDGLPNGTAQGYELLDGLTGFGTTAQMFDAAYWRAKEGELARTIASSPHIRTARVHIANPSTSPFRRGEAASASVTVSTAGVSLSPTQGQALQFLVASAVSGLRPEGVTVIDTAGRLIGSDASEPFGRASPDDRAADMKRRIERILEARVGPGNSVVEVSLETEMDSEQIVERRIDPDSRVAISTEVVETSASSNDTRSEGVTVASNLPDGDGAVDASGASTSSNTETRALTNYEVSETQREVTRAPGAVRRLSVAVLVDGVRSVAADGSSVWVPRDAAELEALRGLVASAVGFDAARGDEITIRTLEFEPVPAVGTEAAPSVFGGQFIDMMSLVQAAVLAVVVLVLGVFVIRPILATSRLPAVPPVAEIPPPPVVRQAAVDELPALNGEIETGPALPDLPAIGDVSDPASTAGHGPVVRLKEMIGRREAETAEVLQSWVEAPRETVR